MHYASLFHVLIMVALANGTPVVATRIFGDTLARPLDGHVKFIDGRPIFGASKTVRGILVALTVTAAAAPLLGLELLTGLLIGASAMTGDLFSSFVKRRMGLPPSSRATGLDQIPESLLPLLACRSALSFSAADIAAGCAIFFVGELLLSNLFFRFRVRNRPY